MIGDSTARGWLSPKSRVMLYQNHVRWVWQVGGLPYARQERRSPSSGRVIGGGGGPSLDRWRNWLISTAGLLEAPPYTRCSVITKISTATKRPVGSWEDDRRRRKRKPNRTGPQGEAPKRQRKRAVGGGSSVKFERSGGDPHSSTKSEGDDEVEEPHSLSIRVFGAPASCRI